MKANNRVVRYLRGTIGQGICVKTKTTVELICWCDSDWATCPNTKRLVTGYVVHYRGSLVSYKYKKQHTVSRSSAEVECRSMALAFAKVTWLEGWFAELNVPIIKPINIMRDSKSSIQLESNPIIHEKTKHIHIDCHFFRDKIKTGLVKIVYFPTQY